MKNLISVGLFALLFTFTGCSVKNDFTVQMETNYEAVKQDYKLNGVIVQLASDSEKTGDLDIFDPEYALKIESSLTKTLTNAKVFKKNAEQSIRVRVKVLKNDAPAMGFTMTVYTDFLYEIKDQKGNSLYQKTISTEGIATIGEAFDAIERMMIANDRSVQNNIKLFMDDIKSKKFNTNLEQK